MEACGRARDCELASAFQLHQLSQKLDTKDIGLDIDGRLAMFKNRRTQIRTLFREIDQKLFYNAI